MSTFRFKGRLQPPTGEPEFWTPPPFKVCPDCEGCGGIENIEVDYEIGMGHAPDCDGTCKNCPVPVQVEVERQVVEPCLTCKGTGQIPVYYTVEQWENLTGRKVPDDMPIYAEIEKNCWRIGTKSILSKPIKCRMVVITEAGRPPKNWRPE